MAYILKDEITAQRVREIFERLPSGTRNTLGQYGLPSDWARQISTILVNSPPELARMDPTMQIGWAVSQIVAQGKVPGSELHDPVQAGQRFAQVLSTAVTKMTNSEMIESLIRDGDSSRAGTSHFLGKQPDVF